MNNKNRSRLFFMLSGVCFLLYGFAETIWEWFINSTPSDVLEVMVSQPIVLLFQIVCILWIITGIFLIIKKEPTGTCKVFIILLTVAASVHTIWNLSQYFKYYGLDLWRICLLISLNMITPLFILLLSLGNSNMNRNHIFFHFALNSMYFELGKQ